MSDRSPITVRPAAGPIDAEVTLPGSKSDTNRALLIAAMAEGTSELEGALFSDDTRYMAAALDALGIPVRSDEVASRCVVQGQAGRIPAEQAELFIGNSGTSVRFLTALCALGHGHYRLDGVARMQERPIGPLLSALQQLGVDAAAERGNGCPPVIVRGRGLPGGTVRLPGDTSSQYFSALLMVAPYAQGDVGIVVEGTLVSKPYVDMTLGVMEAFGVTAEREEYARFRVPSGQRYRGRVYHIEPDASGASYFFAAAAVTGGRVRVLHLGAGSRQGDLQFVRVLERMGCTVEIAPDWTEVRGPEGGRLRGGFEIDMRDISDTAQTAAAIAPLADAPITITGIGFIRRKETDRIGAVVTELNRLGVPARELPDGIWIPSIQPHAGVVQTYDDHRMAMSFAVLGLRVPGLQIADPECVAKTFPDFWERFEHLERR